MQRRLVIAEASFACVCGGPIRLLVSFGREVNLVVDPDDETEHRACFVDD